MSASKNGLKELEKWCKIRKEEYYERANKNISEKCDVELERIKRYKPLPITSRYRKNTILIITLLLADSLTG